MEHQGSEANVYIRKLEVSRENRKQRNKEKRCQWVVKPLYYKRGPSAGYGEKANLSIEPLSEEQRLPLLKKKVSEIKELQTRRVYIEENTKLQSMSALWVETRKSLVTASTFGQIINSRSVSSFKGYLKNTMKSSNFACASISHGNTYERYAIEKFQERTGTTVSKCGLIIDTDIYFLATSPNGFIESEDAFLEVKCPFFNEKKNQIFPTSILHAVQQKLGSLHTYLRIEESTIKLKKHHAYFAQIQGHLNIGRKNLCYFVVFLQIGKNFVDMHVEKIARDKTFWTVTAIPKLEDYFFGTKLPNMVENRNVENLLPYEEWTFTDETVQLYSEAYKHEMGKFSTN